MTPPLALLRCWRGCRRGHGWKLSWTYVSAATTGLGLYFWGDSGSKIAGLDLARVVMAQHLLLSAAARSLSLAKVMRMSDAGVENVFLLLRSYGRKLVTALPVQAGSFGLRATGEGKDFAPVGKFHP